MSNISLKLKDGTVVSYDKPFIITEEYLIKTRVSRGGNTEGPWAYVHPDDKDIYDADGHGRTILVVSANDCLAGIPNGAVYPVLLKGEDRPRCDMDEMIDYDSDMVWCVPMMEGLVAEEIEKYGGIFYFSASAYEAALGKDHKILAGVKVLNEAEVDVLRKEAQKEREGK